MWEQPVQLARRDLKVHRVFLEFRVALARRVYKGPLVLPVRRGCRDLWGLLALLGHKVFKAPLDLLAPLDHRVLKAPLVL